MVINFSHSDQVQVCKYNSQCSSHTEVKMPLSLERWQGKVAIVTGASAGIGAAIAKELAVAGLKVVGLARRSERIDELAKTLTQLYAFEADMTKEEDILKAFEFAKTLGSIHILVNNAGIGNINSLADGDTQKWRDILDVNVLGLSIATREAVRDMRKNNVDGHIVHINSIAGHKIPMPFHMYPPSKHAVTALTETLRQELVALGSKIKITSVSPGYVQTEFAEAAGMLTDPDFAKLNISKLPALKSEDVADAVVYALSTPPHVQIHELIIKPICEKF